MQKSAKRILDTHPIRAGNDGPTLRRPGWIALFAVAVSGLGVADEAGQACRGGNDTAAGRLFFKFECCIA